MKKAVILPLFALLFWASCSRIQNENFPVQGQIPGLATPFKLSGLQSVMHLHDYFIDPALIDSVNGNEAFTFHHNTEKAEVVITARGDELPHYSELRCWIKGIKYSILLEKSQKIKYTFRFDPKNVVYRSVFIFGQMNNWDRTATPLLFCDGVWQTTFELNPGKYHYQLLLDGKEKPDPSNPELVDNNIGGFNSLLTVGNLDFENTPRLYTRSSKGIQVRIGFEHDPEKIFVFWQNYRLPIEYVERTDDRLVITIPEQAGQMKRSYIRLWSYNSNGASNDLLIPLENRSVLTQTSLLTRQDVEAAILYFLMVDRFNNGSSTNDAPITDPDVLPPANYKGGDLAGITQKIKDGYFNDLGVNAIWLSPVTQNPLEAYTEYPPPHRKYSGYHGYWPITLTTVDHRFGTSDDMHEMVAQAHAQGMNVLLDYVSNHVHEKNPILEAHPDWVTELILPDGRKNIRLWDEQRLTTWFDTFLPSLDFSKQEVAEMLSDSAIYWIKKYNLDGFRHDATKHIPEQFWRTLTRKLKDEVIIPANKRIYQIGETFGSRELIGSYVGSGLLDGQFDFNLYFDARSIFAIDNESFIRMNQSLMETFRYYGNNHLMGNITGNHDLPRFISLASGALRFDEDAVQAGWNRNIGIDDPAGYDKLSMLTAFIMTIPGVPVIYYGDEIGIPGGGDPDSRRMMYFENLNANEQKTKILASKLAKLRKERLSLIYGDFTSLYLSDETWVYARRYFNEISIVAFNKGKLANTISFELPEDFRDLVFSGNFGNSHLIENDQLTLTLKPYSFEVLTTP